MKAPVYVPRWRAWAGLVVAPAAWALHHQAGSDLNFFDCRRGDAGTLILIGVTSLAATLLATWVSFAAWRTAGGGPDHKAELSARFVPALSLMAGGLFGLTILLQIAAAAILPPCFR